MQTPSRPWPLPFAAVCLLVAAAHAALLLPRAHATPLRTAAAPQVARVRLVTLAPAAAPTPPARMQASTSEATARPAAEAATPHAPAEPAFFAASQLDEPIVPRSAPELSRLQGQRFSGLPLKLRLFIDASGTVVSVNVLAAQEDPETLNAVVAMFEATAFVPGRFGGRAVSSFTDIELQPGAET
jgi:hypothetical protein